MLYDIDWGAFSLIEFFGSKGNQIGNSKNLLCTQPWRNICPLGTPLTQNRAL